MIKIALYENIALSDGDAFSCTAEIAYASTRKIPLVTEFDSSLEFIERAVGAKAELFDLAIIPFDLPGIDGIRTIEEIRQSQPQLRAIMVDASPDHAAEAAAKSIDAYLVQPISREDFVTTLKGLMAEIANFHNRSVLLSTHEGLRRVAFDSILYCQTSGHDQILHFTDGSTLTMRCSSQAMFELLVVDARFFKTGSSFILNMHEVSELQTSKGTAILSDGTELSIPARLRKPFETALLQLG